MTIATPLFPDCEIVPPRAVEFDAKHEDFYNPDVLWHMEEDIDAEAFESGVRENCTVFCKKVPCENKEYCVDIYQNITGEWLPLGDLGVLCFENNIAYSPSLGCGRIEEMQAFLESKPMSRIYPGKRMKGIILKSLHYYKKFFVPIPQDLDA
jgi:hypothetical protein